MATQRQRIWGWWFFDWASQPYNTLLLTFIFGPYFAETARGYYMGTGMEEEAAKAAPPPLSLADGSGAEVPELLVQQDWRGVL